MTLIECPNCESQNLSWGAALRNTSGATDGRLSLRDITAVFYLGCDGCSETVKTYTSDDVVNLLDAVLAGTITSWNPTPVTEIISQVDSQTLTVLLC